MDRVAATNAPAAADAAATDATTDAATDAAANAATDAATNAATDAATNAADVRRVTGEPDLPTDAPTKLLAGAGVHDAC